MNRLCYPFLLLPCLSLAQAVHASSLIVVEGRGGVSALPYYQDLNPEPTAQSILALNIGVRGSGAFPVCSTQLTGGRSFESVQISAGGRGRDLSEGSEVLHQHIKRPGWLR